MKTKPGSGVFNGERRMAGVPAQFLLNSVLFERTPQHPGSNEFGRLICNNMLCNKEMKLFACKSGIN
ncbi:MAG: hypothetical protein EOL90_06560 [Spartobacteria bacterium]|nr:hypothetical protein [Spartobacteria bacterium]